MKIKFDKLHWTLTLYLCNVGDIYSAFYSFLRWFFEGCYFFLLGRTSSEFFLVVDEGIKHYFDQTFVIRVCPVNALQIFEQNQLGCRGAQKPSERK